MKKGFTLIELLAVIVILAIIALIATPIVLNIIDDTKKSASLRSAEFYLDAVEFAIANATLNNENLIDGTYGITEDGNVCLKHNYAGNKCDEELGIELKGETPFYGSITIDSGLIGDIALVYQNTIVVKDEEGNLAHHNPICTYEDLDNSKTINLSDKVTCGTESFYVMDNDGKYVTMLTEKNLNLDITDPKQSDSYGTISFSKSVYWHDGTNFIVDENYYNEGRQYPYVYGDYKDENGVQQNNLYPYISTYEIYLKKERCKKCNRNANEL